VSKQKRSVDVIRRYCANEPANYISSTVYDNEIELRIYGEDYVLEVKIPLLMFSKFVKENIDKITKVDVTA